MSAQDKFRYYISQIDKELSKYPALNQLEARTQVPKAYSVLGLSALFSTFIFFNVFAGFLTTMLGWGLPAYFSIKALESPSRGDDTQWLTYWTVFGGFQLIEYFSDMILYWFPFYYTFKCAFIVWLMLPSTRGAEVVYHKAIRPMFTSSSPSSYKPVNTTPVPTSASHTL
ncbi:MAG: ER membrane protein DP1/Yop1 [Cyphobasidiales sp. Tagirdzhanova-0007]|nr:MAG: ER membrane protein DP1/Yop1 [Cyphobasidiales sp. Tagirdzhanova-0007]